MAEHRTTRGYMLEIHEEAPRPLQDWVKDEGAMRLRSRALSIPNDDVKLKKRRYADSVSEKLSLMTNLADSYILSHPWRRL